MRRLVYLNRPSKEVVVDLINGVASLPVMTNDVTIDSVNAMVPGTVPQINRNTRAVLKGVGKFTDTKVVYYNRLDLGVLFGTSDVGVPAPFADIESALNYLNTFYGLAIALDEIDTTLPIVNGSADIVITQSLVYTPGSRIRLLADSPLVWFENAVDLYHEYVNFTLPAALAT